ncbi:hypothetical protein PENTCL1PPCAC_20842, partial [Pristionchus entomophagus]
KYVGTELPTIERKRIQMMFPNYDVVFDQSSGNKWIVMSNSSRVELGVMRKMKKKRRLMRLNSMFQGLRMMTKLTLSDRIGQILIQCGELLEERE